MPKSIRRWTMWHWENKWDFLSSNQLPMEIQIEGLESDFNERNRLVLIPDNDHVVFHQIQCVITHDLRLDYLIECQFFPEATLPSMIFLLRYTIRHQCWFPTGIFLIWIIIEITFFPLLIEATDHFRQIVFELY